MTVYHYNKVPGGSVALGGGVLGGHSTLVCAVSTTTVAATMIRRLSAYRLDLMHCRTVSMTIDGTQ